MTKRNARKLIKELKSTLTPQSFEDEVWRQKGQLYIVSIFGPESLNVHYYWDYRNETDKNKTTQRVEGLNMLLDTYLASIDTIGIHYPPKKNIFEGKNYWQVWGITSPVLIFAFYVGYVFGANENPKSIYYNFLRTRIEKTIAPGFKG